jgi:hypothetical protein
LRDGLLAHNEMKFWAYEEFAKGKYLKARKIFKVACRMQERFWANKKGICKY